MIGSHLRQYSRSPSTLLGFVVGVLMYGAYAFAQDAWTNGVLIATCTIVASCLPGYSRLSNKLEERTNQRFAVVTLGRLSRFAVQFAFNLAVFAAFVLGAVVPDRNLSAIGGVIGVALLTTLASQGVQYAAVTLFNRGIGDLNRNVMVALATNVAVTAAATTGLPSVKTSFITLSLVFGAIVFGIGVLSDLRAHFYPQYGVGIFFGTFNPFHVTHVAIIERALRERGLSTSR